MKTPKKRDQKSTKEKLLKAALDIFSKEGYDAATTRNIAKKAGVNESLIHRYFETKAGLFVALKQQFRESVVNDFLENYPESETIQQELINFLKFRLTRTRKNKKFFKMSVARSMVDAKLKEDIQAYARMKPAALMERFEHFRQKGQIRKDIVLDDFINVLHTVAFGTSILSQAVECLEQEEADRLIETAADLLTKGLSPRK